jgi:stage III sporulation protein AG
MEILKKIKGIGGNKRSAAGAAFLGILGLLLLFLSSLFGGEKETEKPKEKSDSDITQNYCSENEERLEAFLENIEGAGEVKVYLTVGSGERYVYASEKKSSQSESKTESEEKFVIVGGSSNREPLVETVKAPEITGAVVICSGCGSPVVEERIYKATAAALDISTSDIYVTIMK